MSEAAHTKADMVYPPYVNLRYDEKAAEFVLTVRSEARTSNNIVFGEGPTSQIRLSAKEMFAWLADATQLVTGGSIRA